MKNIIRALGRTYINTRKARELKRRIESLDFFRSGGVDFDDKTTGDFYTYRRDNSLTVEIDTDGELVTNVSIM